MRNTELDLQNSLRDGLTNLGWTALGGPGAGLAAKTYTTAVGPKEALAYTHVSESAMVLTASYYSEGRNILETVRVAVCPGDDVASKVMAFSNAVDISVSHSYACRLLHGEPQKVL